MNTHEHEALTPEEREIAQRLARLDANASPSTALDAKILAAAHNAMATSSVVRKPKNWSIAFGIAASLALAVGVAWRVRPLPESPELRKAPATADHSIAIEPAAPSKSVQDGVDQMSSAAQPAEAEATAEAAADVTGTIATQSRSEPASASRKKLQTIVSPPSPAEPAVVFDAPQPTAFPPSAAPAAPASMAGVVEGAAAAEVADEAALDRSEINRTRMRDNAPSPRLEAQRQAVMKSNAPDETQVRLDEIKLDEIKRIRALRDAGKLDAARDSLREFQKRYPDYPLPPDLRALLE